MTEPIAMASSAPASAQLRVLCLDGGGVRGLSSLYILDRLMYRIKPEADPKKRIKPCEVFDMIVGTSTGGLIAIMLGILEMDVQSCIEAYLVLAQEIFTPRSRIKLGGAYLHKVFGSATFSAKKLEAGIKRVIRENSSQLAATPLAESSESSKARSDGMRARNTIGEEMPMLGSGRKCKVFVCTVLEDRHAFRIRSYTSRNDPGLPMAVWQAARATTAAPSFFDPFPFGNTTTLRDGGLRNNNPIMEVMREIESEFGYRESDVSCIVSIGTGVSKTEFLRDDLVSVAKACAKIATETAETEALFRQLYAAPGKPLHERYFRFEVDQGLQDMGMEEWKSMNNIWSVTTTYLNDGLRQQMLGKCGALLQVSSTEQVQADTVPKPPDPTPSEILIRDHEFLGLQSADAFIGRDPEMEWLDQVLGRGIRDDHHDMSSRPVVAALTGLGGSGKTQIMLRYAETHLDDYSAMIWIDATTEQTIHASFNRIARLFHIGSAARMNLDGKQESSALIRAAEADDVHALKIWIRMRRRPWLLLFDNLTDILLTRSITQFFPTASLAPGRILISSRRRLARPGWNLRELAGLNNETAARNLLFHYLNFRERRPSAAEVCQGDRIVRTLGLFPLSICLAGSYINVVGNMEQYLSYYDKIKRELMKNTLKGSTLDAYYPASVFIAWKTTLDILPTSAQRLYYLFCAMDRTSISVDLLKRACSSKHRWGSDGELNVMTPTDAGVPSWLLAMCLTGSGEWNELALIEDIHQLESLFLVRRESIVGDWTYNGHVVKRFGTGQSAILIKMEHYVQEIGGLMLEDEGMCEYAAAAICTAIHAIEDDATESLRLKEDNTSFNDCFVVLTPTGGMVNDVRRLMFTLEECFGHVRSASECFPGLVGALQAKDLTRILRGTQYSAAVCCFFILSGIHLGGRSPAAACATCTDLLSAIAFGSLAMQNSSLRFIHDERDLTFWALAAKICRTTEWILWTRKCWSNGTAVVLMNPPALDNAFTVRAGDDAPFFPTSIMTAATMLEYSIAGGQLESPFWPQGGPTGGSPRVSNPEYLDIYWGILQNQVLRLFGFTAEFRSYMGSFKGSTLEFLGCSWLLEIESHIPFRDNLPTVENGQPVTKPGMTEVPAWSYPKVRFPFDEDFLKNFKKSTLFRHIWLGMAIVTSHWVKTPLTEFLPYADTSRLPNRKHLE